MYCKRCKLDAPEGKKFCRVCGSPLISVPGGPDIPVEMASLLIVIAFSILALGVYLSRYRFAISTSPWSTTASSVELLHLHVAFYLISYSLFATALFLAILITVTGNSPRIDWLALSTCAAAISLILGIVCGAMFARVVWGMYFAWDLKTKLALLNGLLSVFVVTPLVLWLDRRSKSRRRFLMVASVLVFPLALGLASFAPVRNQHPAPFFLLRSRNNLTQLMAPLKTPTESQGRKPMSVDNGTIKAEGDNIKFVDDAGQKSWEVMNPETLKGYEGRHVQVTAYAYTDQNAIRIVSVEMLNGERPQGSGVAYGFYLEITTCHACTFDEWQERVVNLAKASGYDAVIAEAAGKRENAGPSRPYCGLIDNLRPMRAADWMTPVWVGPFLTGAGSQEFLLRAPKIFQQLSSQSHKGWALTTAWVGMQNMNGIPAVAEHNGIEDGSNSTPSGRYVQGYSLGDFQMRSYMVLGPQQPR